MPEITARLSTALADRYEIERHLGEGGMAMLPNRELKKRRELAAVALLAITVSIACGGNDTGPTQNEPGNVDEAQSHSVTGVVQDSAVGVPLPNVVVRVGPSVDTTDFLGAYSLSAPSGTHTVTVAETGYETFSTPIALATNTILNVPLRRLAPLVKEFTANGDASELTATIVDLQGAETVEFGNNSAVRVEGPGFGFVIFSGPWQRTQTDATSWRVTVSVGRSGAQKATWFIEDSSGNEGVFECFVGATCTEIR